MLLENISKFLIYYVYMLVVDLKIKILKLIIKWYSDGKEEEDLDVNLHGVG